MERNMTQTALVLGGSGRFGRNATQAFQAAGWKTRQFDRRTGDLMQAARGADVIVNAWNPSYEHWQAQVPKLTAQVIAAAKASGATVIIPGNVYVFGEEAPERFAEATPHAATNPLGKVRVAMEAAYRNAGVQTIVIRAGDFIDTVPTGIWFDRIITAGLAKGVVTYMGRWDTPHAWAYLPDVTRAAVMLAEKRGELGRFEQVPFPGYTLTGEELAQALERVTGRKLTRKSLNWLPFRLMAPFWRLMRHIVEMRYLWSKPHRLDGGRFGELLPGFEPTPLDEALKAAVAGMQPEGEQASAGGAMARA